MGARIVSLYMKEMFSWEALLSTEFNGADEVESFVSGLIPDDLSDSSNLDRLKEINFELERTEQLYKIASENFQELADEMRAGVAVLLDTEIIFANQELASILGYVNEHALIGQRIEQFAKGADRQSIMNTLAKTGENSRVTDAITLVCKDGSDVEAECTLRALSYSDDARMTVIRVVRNGGP